MNSTLPFHHSSLLLTTPMKQKEKPSSYSDILKQQQTELEGSKTNQILDTRLVEEFKGISFSQFKLTDVKKRFMTSVLESNMEESICWSLECIASGHFLELWDCIIMLMSCHIHSGNPKLPIYIQKRMNIFRNIMNTVGISTPNSILRLRNHHTIRELFCEIVCILCVSPKRNKYQTVKVDKENDFDMVHLNHRLLAPSQEYGKLVFQKNDPTDMFIALNEFVYAIHPEEKEKNLMNAWFWIEWLFLYEQKLKKKKISCTIQKRNIDTIEEKYQTDLIWIVWDAIFYMVKKKPPIYGHIIQALFDLYTLRYRPALKRKRRFLLYFAISVLIEPLDMNLPLVYQKERIQKMKRSIGKYYSFLKQCEVIDEEELKKDEEGIQKPFILNSVKGKKKGKKEKKGKEKELDDLTKLKLSLTFS